MTKWLMRKQLTELLSNEALIPNASDFPYLNKGWISNKVDEIRFCVSQFWWLAKDKNQGRFAWKKWVRENIDKYHIEYTILQPIEFPFLISITVPYMPSHYIPESTDKIG